MVRNIFRSQNYFLAFIFLPKKLILPLSGLHGSFPNSSARDCCRTLQQSSSWCQRNCCLLATCTRRLLGFPCAFAICQQVERQCRNNGPFCLSDSSTAQNTSPPLTWDWCPTSSFQRMHKSQSNEKNHLGLQCREL